MKVVDYVIVILFSILTIWTVIIMFQYLFRKKDLHEFGIKIAKEEAYDKEVNIKAYNLAAVKYVLALLFEISVIIPLFSGKSVADIGVVPSVFFTGYVIYNLIVTGLLKTKIKEETEK